MKLSKIISHSLLQLSAISVFLLFFAGAAPEHAATFAPSPHKTMMSTGALTALIILAHITIIGIIPLMYASMWVIFEKAGEEGWKALIPFYSTYILWKISGAKKWVGATAIGSSVVSFLLNFINNVIAAGGGSTPLGFSLVSILVAAAAFIANLFIDISLAESFGKEVAFAIGLFLLPTIFYPILAFKDADYQKVDKN